HAGYAGVDRLRGCGYCGGDRLAIVADQGRQEAGGTEATVGGTDTADRLDAGIVVEQGATAAVDLDVDEAGQQQAALQVHPPRCDAARIVGRQHTHDARTVDRQRPALAQIFALQDAAVVQALPHQCVSVTLRRWGGRSGSWPRATDTALI